LKHPQTFQKIGSNTPTKRSDVNKIFVDTCFILALVNSHDQYHQKALELSVLYEEQTLVTTNGVLLEIGNALARRFKTRAIDIIEEFKTSEEIEAVDVTPSLFDSGFDLYKSHQDKSRGLVDCISFIVMKKVGIDSALTFDQHFVQAGFRALMRENISQD